MTMTRLNIYVKQNDVMLIMQGKGKSENYLQRISELNRSSRKGVRPATLLKMRLWHRCFPVNFAKFRGTSCYITPLVAVSD